MVDLDAARRFVWLNARLLDRHRFAFQFDGGDAEAVLAALQAYQNPDGGFGHALEPDSRGPSSHPTTTYTALKLLNELGRFDDPMVGRALDYLVSMTAPDGGVPVAAPSIQHEPRAPWWNVDTVSTAGSLLPTGGIAGLLHKHGSTHPWLAGATEFCWRAIEQLGETHPYDVHYALAFLEHAPDRARAEREIARLGQLVREQRLVLLDPARPDEVRIPPGYAEGEFHTPLNYAPRPESPARSWFSEAEMTRALDALAQGQGEDGGWTFNWRDWNTAATCEWRGVVTIEALLTLRAYGRL